MITHIKGLLIEKSPTEVVVETNGVGYSINISLNTFSKLGDGDNIKITLPEKPTSVSLTLGFFWGTENIARTSVLQGDGVCEIQPEPRYWRETFGEH